MRNRALFVCGLLSVCAVPAAAVADDGQTIIVTAPPLPPQRSILPPGSGGGGAPPPSGRGGSGGGGTTPPRNDPKHDCGNPANKQREDGADAAAQQAAAQIASIPASTTIEIGYYIIQRANGSVDLGPQAQGTNQGIDSLSPGWLNSGDIIIGTVHNHPVNVTVPGMAALPTPSQRDWDNFTVTTNRNSGHVAPDYQFSVYILGPDGKLREYKRDNPLPTQPTDGISNGC